MKNLCFLSIVFASILLLASCSDTGGSSGKNSSTASEPIVDPIVDIDKDGILDDDDLCPASPAGFISNIGSDADSDGCQDSSEDRDGGTGADSDNDGLDDVDQSNQPLDKCPTGNINWESSSETDYDSDGCQDTDEDPDDDNDNKPDDEDNCPKGVLNLQSADDSDSDGCQDSSEDKDNGTGTDYDNDGVSNDDDSCPMGLKLWHSDSTTDSDNDGCQDADEDIDDNNDGLIEISTVAQLKNIRYSLDGTSYRTGTDDDTSTSAGCQTTGCNGYQLLNDLDLKLATWTPVGDRAVAFTAILDGNSSTIKNVFILSRTQLAGFFGVLDGTVKDLTFMNGSVETRKAVAHVGAVAGTLKENGVLDGISSNLSVKYIVSDGKVGGLVGLSRGIVRNSTATGSLEGSGGKHSMGGLVGHNNSTIDLSSASGAVFQYSGIECFIGGLVGVNEGTITSSSASGVVTGGGNSGGIDFNYSGGLVGSNSSTGIIQDGFAIGKVVGSSGARGRAGGLVGNNEGKIKASYATGNVISRKGANWNGGLVGYNGKTIENSYATGKTTGDTTGEGTGNTFGDESLGGLVGYNAGTIKNSYATGLVKDRLGSGDTLGGLVGTNAKIIESSYSTGEVNGGTEVNNDNVGKFLGKEKTGSSVATSYYYIDSIVIGETLSSVSGAKIKSDSYFKGLTALNTENDFAGDNNGWETDNWDFSSGTYPSVKDLDGSLICNQPSHTHKQC